MNHELLNHRKNYRKVDGILLIDKPLGVTSNKILQTVKRLFAAKKAGHTGSLDPLATGMLPICFGEATKFSQFLLNADKHYLVTAQLGIKTSTGDAEGKIIQQTVVPNFTVIDIENVLEKFRGDSMQLPPQYSAIKHQGKPLYEFARRGIEVAVEPRLITVHQLRLVNYQQHQLQLQVHCSKGTYIRSLIDDVGTMLGCGAYVTELRRTTVAMYQPEQMLTLETLQQCVSQNYEKVDAVLLSIDAALQDYPHIELSPETAMRIQCGQVVTNSSTVLSGLARLYCVDRFIGIGEITKTNQLVSKRLVAIDQSML